MSWCTQKNKNELPNFASKPWGGNLQRHRQNSYQSSIVFFMDWFSSKGWEGTSQKQWSFELNWCPSWLDMCGSFPLKMSDQKSEKNYNEHILLLVFFGLPFEKGGNTQICQGFFTLWLEDSKSAIRDHQIRIALKTSENVLRWWGWIIGKRQDPIRIINPNPGIQRKIDEFQTHSILPLSHIWSFTKKKRKTIRKVSKSCFSKLFRIISGDFFMSYSLQDLHQGGQNFIVDLSRWISLRWLRCRVTVGWTPSHFSHFFGFFPPLADLDPEDPLDPFSSGSKRRSSATTSGKALWTSW